MSTSFYEPSPTDELASRYDDPIYDHVDESPEMESADADIMISNALKELSLEERDQVYLDQHGVADMMEFEDNPELVAQKLEELEKCLRALSSNVFAPSQAYEVALRQNPEFVQDHHFRLRFLYAELFNTQKAAKRMIRYFNFKKSLFGEGKLTKHIELTDLSSDEIAYLKEGHVQLLPSRDTVGRPVLVALHQQSKRKDSEGLGRILFVFEERVDRKIEKKGIVIVSYHHGDFSRKNCNLREAYIGSRAVSDLSLRIAAIHQCIHDRRFRLKVNIFMMFSDRETRAKHKIHCGTHRECMNALMTYGIPHSLVPIGDDGKIKRKNHLEWIRQRGILEDYRRSRVEVDFVELPASNDVLLGKGSPIQEHWGNKSLSHLVDELLPLYDSLNGRAQKKKLTLGVILNVKAQDGRFLTQESGVWTEVSLDVAREKVSHLFRNRRKQAKCLSTNPPLPLGRENTENGVVATKRVRLA